MKFKQLGVRTLIISDALIAVIIAGSVGLGHAIANNLFNQSQAPAPVYPIDESGQTYGSSADAISRETEPDLICALGVDGIYGYVRSVDLNEEMPKTPQEALDQMAKNAAIGARQIPLYAVDGKTVIGVFNIHNTQPTDISIEKEEAQ